jgi:hypothetical protein
MPSSENSNLHNRSLNLQRRNYNYDTIPTFQVCGSVHLQMTILNKTPTRCTIKLKVFKIYLLVHCSKYFGHHCAHHKSLHMQSLVTVWYWVGCCFQPCSVNSNRAVFVVGPAGPTTNTARRSPRYEGKTRGCHCSH